jgi:hypothetical protein
MRKELKDLKLQDHKFAYWFAMVGPFDSYVGVVTENTFTRSAKVAILIQWW